MPIESDPLERKLDGAFLLYTFGCVLLILGEWASRNNLFDALGKNLP